MVKVSVLVPIYNVEKYLPQCLESLINQTLSDIEIVCVDDGSTDRSATILDEYARRDCCINILLICIKVLNFGNIHTYELNRGWYLHQHFAITKC